MIIDDINRIDKHNMFRVIADFPEQVAEAVKIGQSGHGFILPPVSNDFVVLGMGGSAIGGDLLSSYLSAMKGASHIRIAVNRKYDLPGYVDENTNIIASSYSGGTEETLSGLNQALKLTKRIACITSGGELKSLSEMNKLSLTIIPGGLQPRAALGYSFFPMLLMIMKSGLMSTEAIISTDNAIHELITLLKEKSEIYTDFENPSNIALEIAKKIHGTQPIIYSSSERYDSINLRWRCQIQENSKNFAFGNLLPEMNHNEINSWDNPTQIVDNSSIIFVRDSEDHPKVKIRFDALREILSGKREIIEIRGEGDYLLTRMFDIIYLGDWVSYYLALLNGADPTPIPLISKLKIRLSENL